MIDIGDDDSFFGPSPAAGRDADAPGQPFLTDKATASVVIAGPGVGLVGFQGRRIVGDMYFTPIGHVGSFLRKDEEIQLVDVEGFGSDAVPGKLNLILPSDGAFLISFCIGYIDETVVALTGIQETVYILCKDEGRVIVTRFE